MRGRSRTLTSIHPGLLAKLLQEGGASRGPCTHLLAEAILEATRQILLVAHAASAAVLPADHLLAPVVMPIAGGRIPAGAADLLLNVEGGAATAAAGCVRLLDLLL